MISFYLLFPFVFSYVIGKAISTYPKKTNPNIFACLTFIWSPNLMVVFGREFFVLGTKASKPTWGDLLKDETWQLLFLLAFFPTSIYYTFRGLAYILFSKIHFSINIK